MAYLSANDSAILADLSDEPGGFSVGPPTPYDPIGMAWANGRRCSNLPDPGPIAGPVHLWRDGTPLKRYPQPPSASEWRATVAKHGLPTTSDGKIVGVGWPQEHVDEALLNAANTIRGSN